MGMLLPDVLNYPVDYVTVLPDPSAYTHELEPGLLVDVSLAGKVVGVEVINGKVTADTWCKVIRWMDRWPRPLEQHRKDR